MLLFIGLSGCAISLAIEAAIVAVYAPAGTNRTALSVGVAALFLFESFYSVSVDICYFVISVELFPTHLRAKGTTLAFSSTVLTNVVFLQAAPTAFANIGWKYFLVSRPLISCIIRAHIRYRSLSSSPLLALSGSISWFQKVARCHWRKWQMFSASTPRLRFVPRIFISTLQRVK
jgi:hypothetical protein